MSYLQVQQLRKSFDRKRVIDDVSLCLERGEFVSLLGPSGCGKTTILRCLAGLENPDLDSGAIVLDGQVLSGPAAATVPVERRGMGMVFQSYAVWPHLTVFENVAFPLRIDRAKPSQTTIAGAVERALEMVHLQDLTKRFPHELSGGQQQRVALARALVRPPRLLLLDEPLSNLDALLREGLGGEIRRLAREFNLTTIMVTHDQKEALALSDRIILLADGKIAAVGTPETLYATPPSDFVAEFLAGGQRLRGKDGADRIYLPRRWQLLTGGQVNSRILARIFRGTEYEYIAAHQEFAEPVHFFEKRRWEMGADFQLNYQE